MRGLITYIFCLMYLALFSQRYDYHWMLGSSPSPPNPNYRLYAPCHIDFIKKPVYVYREYWPINMDLSGLAICDKNGELQFATDGIHVFNRNGLKMPNGFGLSSGVIADEYATAYLAYPSYKGCMAIPKPGSDSIYYLFYTALDYDNARNISSGKETIIR